MYLGKQGPRRGQGNIKWGSLYAKPFGAVSEKDFDSKSFKNVKKKPPC